MKLVLNIYLPLAKTDTLQLSSLPFTSLPFIKNLKIDI